MADDETAGVVADRAALEATRSAAMQRTGADPLPVIRDLIAHDALLALHTLAALNMIDALADPEARRLWQETLHIFSDEEVAARWWITPKRGLAGRSPHRVATEDPEALAAHLARIDYNVPL